MKHRFWIAAGSIALVACGGNKASKQASYSAQTPAPRAAPPATYPRTNAPAASSNRGSAGPVAMPTSGQFTWASTLSEAKASARSTNRLIFLEAGRPGCGNCQALKNKVVPDPSVTGELGAVSVGYYDDIDRNPNSEAVKILYANLPSAVMLPLVGWVTPDMRWVHGFSGGTNPSKFRQDIATARASYMRMAEIERPAARRTMAVAPTSASLPDAELADVVAELGAEAERDLATPVAMPAPTASAPMLAAETPPALEPAPVVAAAEPAAAPIVAPTPIASPAAPPAAPEVALALPSAPVTAPAEAAAPIGDATRTWARENLEHAKDRLTTRDYAGARAILAEVKAKAVGLPEEREAEKGEVAIYNLRKIERSSVAADAAKAREQAQRDLKNTVWASLFA